METFAGLGTRMRHVLELLDGDVARVYADLGVPDYRPRYSPVIRALVALGPLSIRDLAGAVGVTHSAASQTAAQMARHGLLTLEPGSPTRPGRWRRTLPPPEPTRSPPPGAGRPCSPSPATMTRTPGEAAGTG